MWFLKDLGRLNQERGAIEVLERESDWLDGVRWRFDGPNLAVDADIVLDESRRHPIRLRFPEVYPSAPASVRPQDPGRLSNYHQYGPEGDLCLELGPDNWHPDSHNAALLLESAYRLLMLEADHDADDSVEIPSRHAPTPGQEQRTKHLRWVATPAAIEALNALPEGPSVRCDVIDVFHEEAMTAFLQRIEDTEGNEGWVDPDVPETLRHKGRRLRGVIVTRPIGALTLSQIGKADVVTSLLEDPPVPDSRDTDADNDLSNVSYVFHKSYGGTWQAHCRWSGGAKLWNASTLETDTAEATDRHGLDGDKLAKTRVAIVGLGSVGSKIAASLARSGVSMFYLLDDDLLHSANIVRHDGDWLDVGQHKVDAVADRLRRINKDVQVVRRRHRLRGQEASSAAASVLASLGKADLIIDSTANPRIFTLCAHVARLTKTAFLWMEVFAGGIGGMIARARPDTDAEPFTLRAAVHGAANEIAEVKAVEAPEGAADYGAEVEDKVVIATDADVSVMAAHAAQMGLDTLLEREPSRFCHPAYLVGFSAEWVFEEAFHTIPIDCSAPVDWSSIVQTNKATREDASAFIVNLLENTSADADAETTP